MVSIVQQNKKCNNKFKHFCRKVLSKKHGYWFECLDFKKRRRLYYEWNVVRYKLKSPSFNKFLFNARRSKTFYINPSIIRDKAINKILEI